MVDEATRDTKMSLEEKGFVNYWLRHPWEYILPLYPGILLASAISKIELRDFITVNLSYAVLTLITGFVFGMRGVRVVIKMNDGLSREGIWSFIPIAAVLLLVVMFHVELHYALITTVLALFFFYRYKLRATPLQSQAWVLFRRDSPHIEHHALQGNGSLRCCYKRQPIFHGGRDSDFSYPLPGTGPVDPLKMSSCALPA